MRRPRILVLDNGDSFTFNAVEALREEGAATAVIDSRRISADEVCRMRIDGLVVSPGPGRPGDAGCANEVLRVLPATIPTWGICLGHQCLAEVHGARVVGARMILHGKTAIISHDGRGLFEGLAAELEVMRYNSLLVDPESLPGHLEVSAWSDSGEVMAIRCRRTGAEGVQFHPESVMSGGARPMFTRFVSRCAGTSRRWREAIAS